MSIRQIVATVAAQRIVAVPNYAYISLNAIKFFVATYNLQANEWHPNDPRYWFRCSISRRKSQNLIFCASDREEDNASLRTRAMASIALLGAVVDNSSGLEAQRSHEPAGMPC
jgi:hypothetical protein